MDLKEKRNILFDDNFECKSENVEEVTEFCDKLRNITGVQVCNYLGMRYEYLPAVYNSAINNRKA